MTGSDLLVKLKSGDARALARCISLVENDTSDAAEILENLAVPNTSRVIGITGPPGAGKSTLVSALLDKLSKSRPGIRLAVVAIDPTSPFNHGSLLGDRLRMNEHFNNPDIFIRSLATRGALGGLSSKTIEVTDVLKAAGFEYIFVETVGVGQSEIEIASLADTTIVVFVPESGDEIQTIKSGIMEIADIFVVNKADREGADQMVKSLHTTLHERQFNEWSIPVLKTNAANKSGIDELLSAIDDHAAHTPDKEQHAALLFNKALRLVQNTILKKIDVKELKADLAKASADPRFNVYRFISGRFS